MPADRLRSTPWSLSGGFHLLMQIYARLTSASEGIHKGIFAWLWNPGFFLSYWKVKKDNILHNFSFVVLCAWDWGRKWESQSFTLLPNKKSCLKEYGEHKTDLTISQKGWEHVHKACRDREGFLGHDWYNYIRPGWNGM